MRELDCGWAFAPIEVYTSSQGLGKVVMEEVGSPAAIGKRSL
jgi:hypothetical protein